MSVEPTIIRVDLESDVPAYRQIVDALRTHLVSGTLAPDDSLPPVRRLAADLGVHFNTVAEAYRILAEEGWLELRRRTGARVIVRKPPGKASERQKQAFVRRLNEIAAEAMSQGVSAREIWSGLHLMAERLESAGG
jgi:DNA-binding transcriptional regulator YhcF (GntR family)